MTKIYIGIAIMLAVALSLYLQSKGFQGCIETPRGLCE